MSEQSIQLRSQLSLRDINVSTDSAGRPIVPHGASQARKHCKYKPRFAEFSCTFVEASRIILILRSATDREIQGLSLRDACHGCGHTKGRVGLQEESQTDQRACVRIFTLSLDATDVTTDVKSFITARRYETTTIHNILQGFSTTECDWLAPDRVQPRVALTDALKRRELLEDFLFWYFDSFLIPLLRVSSRPVGDGG